MTIAGPATKIYPLLSYVGSFPLPGERASLPILGKRRPGRPDHYCFAMVTFWMPA